MNIQKDIETLLKDGIINEEVANRISNYYTQREGSSTNRLQVIFAILGAILIGLGIILMVAHNWDELPKLTKTIFSFIPLVIGQISCGYVLFKKTDSKAWREASSGFLFLSVGASIALISQIYHISGDLSGFLLIWLLLCLPLIYIMSSSIASLFYIVGITWYALLSNNFWGSHTQSNFYWLLLLGVLPYYWLQIKKQSESNYITFHHWFIPLSVTIALGATSNDSANYIWLGYVCLFGLFFLISQFPVLSEKSPIKNGYLFLGAVGTSLILILVSFNWFWDTIGSNHHNHNPFRYTDLDKPAINYAELIHSAIITLLAITIFIFQQKKKIELQSPFAYSFLLFIPIFFIGQFSTIAPVLINLLLLFIGIMTIRTGNQKNHLGILNFGLLLIAALAICRFFDQDLSFLIRGALFILVGTGFFWANFQLIKKRKTND